MADNESQWPAQYPGDDGPADPQGPNAASDDRPTAAEAPPTTSYVPMARPYVPPASRSVPPYIPPAAPYLPPAGYPIPPAGYQVPPAGYPIPPAGYQVPLGGYHIPPGGYQVPSAGYQVQTRMNPGMRAASADRERAVDVLKAGFAEGRLTQDEYNDRMGRAYAARTYGELMALTADLPAGAVPAVWAWRSSSPWA